MAVKKHPVMGKREDFMAKKLTQAVKAVGNYVKEIPGASKELAKITGNAVVNAGKAVLSAADKGYIEKAEKGTKIAKTVVGTLPYDKAKKVSESMGKISTTLGAISKGTNLYKNFKLGYEYWIWAVAYKDAVTEADKIKAGKQLDNKALDIIAKLADFASPFYGRITELAVKMAKQVITAAQIKNAETKMYGQLLGPNKDRFQDLIDCPFFEIVAEMYSNGATVLQMESVVKELKAIEAARK
ncbi:MAG: hypothetical protein LBI06_05425 [Treponema sp.]|jgi:hypothetical protein|nr:hypothetical protein [Treponema sp.]